MSTESTERTEKKSTFVQVENTWIRRCDIESIKITSCAAINAYTPIFYSSRDRYCSGPMFVSEAEAANYINEFIEKNNL